MHRAIYYDFFPSTEERSLRLALRRFRFESGKAIYRDARKRPIILSFSEIQTELAYRITQHAGSNRVASAISDKFAGTEIGGSEPEVAQVKLEVKPGKHYLSIVFWAGTLQAARRS